ncbi:hypothetical protein NMG60_11007700 [Bertholletia excelsa]
MELSKYPSGDTTFTKVFVGGLAWETKSVTLRRHFEQFGEIIEAVVITDKHTGRSKGYGFVTFCNPESAKKACIDPNPIIDGRRANCNLASLGRFQPFFPHGYLQSTISSFGMPQMPRGAYMGHPCIHQPFTFSYQPEAVYTPYGYAAYGPEYAYPQGVYNPYMGQHYIQMYGLHGMVNTKIVSHGQIGQPLPGSHRHKAIPSCVLPGNHVLPYELSRFSGATTETIASVQIPNYTGIPIPAPGQAQIIIPAHPVFTQSGGSAQTAG